MSNIDSSIELDIASVKKKSIKGVFSLVGRTLIIQVVSFISNLGLTILLAPKEYGVFILVSAITGFLTYLSDIGLAAALIQKKEALTRKDLVTTFTIQQALVGILVSIGLIFTLYATKIFDLNNEGVWLLRILIFSLFISSLKTIPSVLLERKLAFEKFIIPQIIENLLFSVSVLFLAWKGYGISSFTYAVILRSVSGLIAIYIISPWKPGLGFDKATAKSLINFGVLFQMNSILALLKDDFMTILLGKILTVSQIGYLGWAQKWAYMPLRIIMDNVIKVTFPAFARLQSDKIALSRAIEEAIFISAGLTFPILTCLLLSAENLINIIPNYQKWLPAYNILAIYIAGSYISSVTIIITNALNSIGKIKITLRLMVFWTGLTWILTIPLSIKLQELGVALAWLMVTLSSLYTFYIGYKHLSVNAISSIFSPILSAFVLGVYLKFVFILFQPTSIYAIFGLLLSGIFLYSFFILISSKERTIKNIMIFKNSIKK